MRTFLSHDATARWLLTGEKARSEMLSSGGEFKATSFEMSPVVLVAAVVAAVVPTFPKRPDIQVVLPVFLYVENSAESDAYRRRRNSCW